MFQCISVWGSSHMCMLLSQQTESCIWRNGERYHNVMIKWLTMMPYDTSEGWVIGCVGFAWAKFNASLNALQRPRFLAKISFIQHSWGVTLWKPPVIHRIRGDDYIGRRVSGAVNCYAIGSYVMCIITKVRATVEFRWESDDSLQFNIVIFYSL